MILSHLKVVIPTIIIGQGLIWIIINVIAGGLELGILFIGPIIILIGVIIQLVFIFIKVNGTFFTKFIFTVLGLLLAILLSNFINLATNSYRHKDDKVDQSSLQCYEEIKTMIKQTGLDKIYTNNPQFNERVRKEQEFYDNCMKSKGYTYPYPQISLPSRP